MVIDSEIERCNNLISQLKGYNDELVSAIEERIDILQFQKESIEGDIQNELLTPKGYLKQIQSYF